MWEKLIAVVVSYLVGSISFARLSSQFFKLPDPTSYGSGNSGATNVLRTGHYKAALFTLLGDFLKVFITSKLLIFFFQKKVLFL